MAGTLNENDQNCGILAQFHFGRMDYCFRTVFRHHYALPRFQTDEGHTGVLCLAAEAKCR